MKKLGASMDYLVANLAADSDQARVNLRARQVRSRYREAIQAVYRENAQMFLDHTNNVYIMKRDDVKTLVVYVDDSIFSAELNAQRELIRLKLLELFGEDVEDFKIFVSRGDYKKLHPYAEEENNIAAAPSPLPELSIQEKASISQTASNVEDERLRKSFEKAMTANLARKKEENGNAS